MPFVNKEAYVLVILSIYFKFKIVHIFPKKNVFKK
jgi:hypothetical protein